MEKLIEALRHLSLATSEGQGFIHDLTKDHIEMAQNLIKDFLREEGGYNVHTPE